MPTRQPDSTPVRISLRIYSFLILLYPLPFRGQYRELMEQLFRDSCRAASRKTGAGGVLALWSRTLLDLLLSVIEQHTQRGVLMTKTKWIQLSGWLMTAAGPLLLLGQMAASRPAYSEYDFSSWPIDRYLNAAAAPLILLGLLCTLAGISGLSVHFATKSGSLGRAGLALSLAGTVAALAGASGLAAVPDGPWWQIFMLGFSALYLGLALFGVSSIRRKLFLRWNRLPLLFSLPWILLVLAYLLINALNGEWFAVPEAVILAFLIVSFGGIGLVGFLLQAAAGKTNLTEEIG